MNNKLSTMHESDIEKRISNFQNQFKTLKQESLGKLSDKWFYIEKKSAQQSRLFMIDIIPHIHRLYYDLPRGATIKVLDVGIHCGAGTALLAELHNKYSHNHLKMDVTGLDIVDNFKDYIQLSYPLVKFIRKDIFEIPNNKKWDLVICSHVIEHLKNPFAFVEQLRKLTTKYVIVACPYNEVDLRPGHLQTINDSVIEKLNPLEHHVYTNFCWRVRGKCLIMVFKSI